MAGNMLGLLYSLLLIGLCVLVSIIVEKRFNLPVVARKIIHIGVSNWYFIYLYLFDTWLYPVLGLVGFAFLNFLVEKKKRTTSWGTVEYPLVIAALVVLVQLGFGTKQTLGCALLGMGYGDGLAAIFGTYLGKRKMPFSSDKTIIGSVVCFAVVSIVVYLVSGSSVVTCLVLGLASSLVEAYTPFGLDNISVPVAIFLLARFMC